VKIIKQSILEKLTKKQLLEQQRLYQDENKIIAEFDLKEYQNKISKVELLKEEIQEECDIIKKKAKKPVFEFSESKEEVKKIDTSYDDLYAYQKKREAEREAQLEKEREKLKKKEIKFNFTTPKKDWSNYGGWVNPFEPINKGRLGSTQEWRIEKPKRHYY